MDVEAFLDSLNTFISDPNNRNRNKCLTMLRASRLIRIHKHFINFMVLAQKDTGKLRKLLAKRLRHRNRQTFSSVLESYLDDFENGSMAESLVRAIELREFIRLKI